MKEKQLRTFIDWEYRDDGCGEYLKISQNNKDIKEFIDTAITNQKNKLIEAVEKRKLENPLSETEKTISRTIDDIIKIIKES